MSNIDRFDIVELLVDIPEFKVNKGTRGVVLDIYETPVNGYCLELFDENYKTIDVVDVMQNDVALIEKACK